MWLLWKKTPVLADDTLKQRLAKPRTGPELPPTKAILGTWEPASHPAPQLPHSDTQVFHWVISYSQF